MTTGVITTDSTALTKTKVPALPLAPIEYTQKYQDDFANILRLYFNTIDNFVGQVQAKQSIDYIDFNTTPGSIPHQTGRVNWAETDATLEVDMEYGVIQQVGQETYARVKNVTGVTIPNGTAVGFAGASPDSLEVAPYIANGTLPTVYILGVMTHDLPDSGEKGYCTVFGFVRGLDTTGAPYGETWALGDVLYVSPTIAGGFTKFKPTVPNNVIIIAAVTTVDSTDGVIFVRPTIAQQAYYGTFSRTTNYSPAVANTAYAVEYTNTDLTNGVSIGTPSSRIVVVQSGLYDVSATLQWSSTNSSSKEVYGWIRKNGTDIARSCRISTIVGNGSFNSAVISEAVALVANDYIEIMVATSSDTAYLNAAAPTAFSPAAPAINLIVEQIQP